ncbi:MAG TPA: NAD(P)/FAD-dependent oxidoreductase [Gemmatimonadaceae bacterium]|jgi:thioredoxin reductase|nr:NAD(P)/FAD-dependent oxidoreductase [Gemmatimonadaceae bacterium]
MPNATYDAIVIGGSWAGLSATMQLARARRRVLVVDAGQPRNRFAHTSHGFLGQDGRTPAAILDTARAQVLAYPTAEFRPDEATRATPVDDGPNVEFEVSLGSGATVRARRLVLATGVVDELPDIPGLRERWGRSVLHCPYCHGYEVAGKRLGVMAVSEASMHQALLLPDWSAHVTLFTNGAFEPTDEHRATLDARGVTLDPRPLVELVGDGERLGGVRVAGDGGTDVVGLDALFTGSRTRMASPLAEQLGCAFDEGPFGPVIRTDAKKETTVPKVYAAGDAARVPHNATWASADGVTAGIYAHQSLALVSV